MWGGVLLTLHAHGRGAECAQQWGVVGQPLKHLLQHLKFSRGAPDTNVIHHRRAIVSVAGGGTCWIAVCAIQ